MHLSETRNWLAAIRLQLKFDEGDRRDKNVKKSAYAYVDGKSVQETLLNEGLARVAYVYELNTKYIDQFKKDEEEANQRSFQFSVRMECS